MNPMWRKILPPVAIAALLAGQAVGLWYAPVERYMGDVYRLIFVHVPAAWVALLAFSITFGASITYLFKGSYRADSLAGASAEIGVIFGGLAVVLGSIWGRAAWAVWWTWDPRLTSTAILVMGFAGYLALRQFVEDTERRATWSAVAALILSADVPIVWFSVKWWGGLHQIQSDRQSMDATVGLVLLANALAMTLVFVWFLALRYNVAKRRLDSEMTEPPALEPTEENA